MAAVQTRTARAVALEVLHRVEVGDAYSNVLLHRVLGREPLSDHDRALITELVLGTLRQRALVVHALGAHLSRPLEHLPALIRSVLLLGAYQLLFLRRMPRHVAVHESVELAKRVGHRGTAGLVNAVLRRIADEGMPPLPGGDEPASVALRHSHPSWLAARWIGRWDLRFAEELMDGDNAVPPTSLRVNTLKTTLDSLRAALADAGVASEPSAIAPDGLRIAAGGYGERLPMYEAGLFHMQDEGSMLVAHAVAPQPGEVVIDACAAPGGKTGHLAQVMQDRGRVIAADVDPAKLQALSMQMSRLGVEIVEAHHLDAREVGRAFTEQADAVLVDAPCTGLGVVRRRPEIKWRVRAEDLTAAMADQLEMLYGVARAVKRGGRLIYSVCTLEPEETRDVVARFLVRFPEFAPDGFDGPPALSRAQARAGREGEALLFPHLDGTDGFYIARMRRAA